jgi:CDP-glycerol glycerophosphotransferase
MVPRLSVIVPCFRAEASVTGCLDSILAGGGADIEVVAVDDGSPDETGPVLDAYADREARVRVVHLATNGGPGNARNVGIDEARGEYLWFVDADDRLPEGAVDAVLDRLRVHEPDVLIVDHAEVFGTTVVPRRTVDRLGPLEGPVRLADEPRLLRLAPSACTKVVRRAVLERTGLRFPPGRYEDAFFSPALLLAAGPIDVLHQVCYLYRQGTPGSTTTSSADWHFDVFDQYERLFALTPTTAPRAVPGDGRPLPRGAGAPHAGAGGATRGVLPARGARRSSGSVRWRATRGRAASAASSTRWSGSGSTRRTRCSAGSFRMLPRSAPDRRGR